MLPAGSSALQQPANALQAPTALDSQQQAFLLAQQAAVHQGLAPQQALAQAAAKQQPQQRGPPSAAGDLHRLKICGVPVGSFTDAKLRQLFDLCGKVRPRGQRRICANAAPRYLFF